MIAKENCLVKLLFWKLLSFYNIRLYRCQKESRPAKLCRLVLPAAALLILGREPSALSLFYIMGHVMLLSCCLVVPCSYMLYSCTMLYYTVSWLYYAVILYLCCTMLYLSVSLYLFCIFVTICCAKYIIIYIIYTIYRL